MKPMILRAGEAFPQYWIAGEFALRNCLVNSRQVLIDDPAGSQAKVANFRVAHLSIRQADVSPARAQFSTWIVPVELVMKRCLREECCVRIFFALLSTARIDAPAIANNEHNWTSHMRGTLPTIPRVDKRFFFRRFAFCEARAEMIKAIAAPRKLSRLQHLISISLIFATVTDRRYRRENEMAQSIAGPFLFARLCRPRCSLFSTLGRPKAFRNYPIHRRGTCTRSPRGDASICRRG